MATLVCKIAFGSVGYVGGAAKFVGGFFLPASWFAAELPTVQAEFSEQLSAEFIEDAT